MKTEPVKQLLDICIALSAERDREALLFRILDTAMDLTHCDGGTLYLLEHNVLCFCRMETRSLGVKQSRDAISLPPVPLNPSHVCARAVLEKRLINVADVKKDTRFDFSGAVKYDSLTGYDTHSMLVLPLTSDSGHIIGVLQLINALDEDGRIASFPSTVEPLVSALASQAAISLTNMQYADQVRELLDSLVRALSEAIDERTPYNANHSRSMARYGERFLNYLEASGSDWQFDSVQRRAFLLSVWLHYVGKLTVPLAVMDKDSRLGPRLKDIRSRFSIIGLLNKITLLEGRQSDAETAAISQALEAGMTLIEKANTAAFLPEAVLAEIDTLASRVYQDDHGVLQPWLTPEEHQCLSIQKGTLTPEEREIMENHVCNTAKILGQVSFPEEYAQVPVWAAAHHELLNGRGYPDHKFGQDLPKEVRLMTILDIYDALTAADRPYKPPLPPEKAFGILESMAREGSLDAEILTRFRESRAWERES